MSDFVNTVDSIGSDALLTKIIEGTLTEFSDNRVSVLGTAALQGCNNLTKVDFPALQEMGSGAFYGVSKLDTVILRNSKLCTMRAIGALNGTAIRGGTGYIYVPSALIDSYKSATNWSTYAAQFRAIEDYPDITGG
jgi:hypothetical protein